MPTTPIPIPSRPTDWEGILRHTGWEEWRIPLGLDISWCESRWQDVQNYGGGPYYGRFQIGLWAHADKLRERGYSVTPGTLLDPFINAEIALLIMQREGTAPWERVNPLLGTKSLTTATIALLVRLAHMWPWLEDDSCFFCGATPRRREKGQPPEPTHRYDCIWWRAVKLCGHDPRTFVPERRRR